MRILIGVIDIAGQIPLFADGFRKLGHQVTTVIFKTNRFTPGIQYDVNLRYPVRWPEWVAENKSLIVKLPRYAINQSVTWTKILGLIASHDVFVFQWARSSLLPGHADFPFIKRLGKRIVSLFVGSDVRDVPAYKQWYAAAKEIPFQDEPLVNSLRSVRMHEMYSDLILSVPNQAVLALRPYDHFFVPLDLSAYPFNLPARDIPVVVHAPSRKGYKGTNHILKALDQLKAEGVLFEARFLDGIPHQKLIGELANADVVIDEMFFPLHGKLTVESLASGCAVATGDRQDYEPFPPDRPIWYINPDNVHSQLKRLLTDKELRISLAKRGREYAEKYYNHKKVSQRILEGLNSGSSGKRDHYPAFFASEYCLPEGEIIPKDLKRMTTQVIRKWGLPPDVDPMELLSKGFVSPDLTRSSSFIPRWSVHDTNGYLPT